MKVIVFSLVFFAASVLAAENGSPIAKIIQMLGDLEQKIIAEGEASQKVFTQVSASCEDRARELQHEIKTGEDEKASLEATIEKETATAAALSAKIEELAAAISASQGDLQAATNVRSKEKADFDAAAKELSEVINTLGRAINLIEREMAKTGAASMIQLQNANSLTDALSAIVHASMISTADASRLSALIQTSDAGAGAPDAAVYSSQSGGIVGTLEDMKDKAEEQLAEKKKEEMEAKHNFEMLQQSLQDEIDVNNKSMKKAKRDLASSNEAQATAEGDLEVASKALAENRKALDALHHDCMTKAQDFEAEVKSRGEELKALATAKKVIKETTGGADALSYSFVQVSNSAPFEAMKIVRELGRKENSAVLTQLSLRMASAMNDNSGGDPFEKVKGLITGMIDKLEKEAGEEADHKAWCDKEFAESREKKADKEAVIEKLTTQIDSQSAKSAKLKEQIADLQKALAELAATQVEMNKIRSEEKALFTTSKAELEQGLSGVKSALKVLRDYYAKDKAHSSADGAGSGIIGLLEVCESDFSKGLAETVTTEENAQAAYDSETKENEIEKTTKDQDVKYKTKESTGLDKSTTEANSDRSAEQEELDAVNEYLTKLDKQCVPKAESYADKKARREAEIAGLKEALQILSETSFVQKKTRRSFRGSVIAA